jgi:hypothetical protein
MINRLAAFILLGMALASACPRHVDAQTNDPLNGTWILNAAKSTFPRGGPAPKSQILTIEGTGATKKVVSDTIDAQGRQARQIVMHIYDGQPHPVSGSPYFDALAYTRIDANNIVFTRMRGGKLTGIGSFLVSSDGKSFTTNLIGIDDAGGKYGLFFDRK